MLVDGVPAYRGLQVEVMRVRYGERYNKASVTRATVINRRWVKEIIEANPNKYVDTARCDYHRANSLTGAIEWLQRVADAWAKVADEVVADRSEREWDTKMRTCRVCGKEVDEETRTYAMRRFEQQACSVACLSVETKKRFACCEKAEFSNCVCFVSFACPVHGNTHIGTHD